MELAASVTLGSTETGTRFCELFGGLVYPEGVGRFKARRAPAPDRCQLPESYY